MTVSMCPGVAGSRPAGRTAAVYGSNGVAVRRVRAHDRVLARWRSRSLDAELRAGLVPETRWLRAVRAAQLTAPAERDRIATGLECLRAQACGTSPAPRGVVPIARARVAAAGDLIAELVEALRRPAPVAARGVAAAAAVLTDAGGGLYLVGPGEDPSASLAEAVRYLEATSAPMPFE